LSGLVVRELVGKLRADQHGLGFAGWRIHRPRLTVGLTPDKRNQNCRRWLCEQGTLRAQSQNQYDNASQDQSEESHERSLLHFQGNVLHGEVLRAR
jgi:hypothetical protein